MVTVLVIVGRSDVRAIVWTPPGAMLKSIVSPPAPAFTLPIAPRREQSFAAAVQALRFASDVVSTVNVLAADAGAAARASAAKVAPNVIRIVRPLPRRRAINERPSHFWVMTVKRERAIWRRRAVPHRGAGRLNSRSPPLLAQLVEHFHGKEGVIGSSPMEGLRRAPNRKAL